MSVVDSWSEFEPHSTVDVVDLQHLTRVQDLVPEVSEYPADNVLYSWVSRWIANCSGNNENKERFSAERRPINGVIPSEQV